MIQKHPCACGCGILIPIKDKKGRLRKWVKGHHSYRPMEQCFWEKVKKTSTCWIWTGARLGSGYGQLGSHRTGIFYQAHRFSWILHNGQIPVGIQCLHHCDNPPCVRPSHLFLGTHTDNMRDKVEKGRQTRGTKSPNSVLTPNKVRKIRQLYTDKKHSQRGLGKLFNVCKSTIRTVIQREAWAHID